MKAESQDSPSSAALATRIAKYSYGSPDAKLPTRGHSESTTPTRSLRNAPARSPITIGISTSGIVRSPHFPSQQSSGSPSVLERGGRRIASCPVARDDDLESIDDEEIIPELSAGQSSSGTSGRVVVERADEEESDGLSDLVSTDDDDDEGDRVIQEPSSLNPHQTRIRASRAGRGGRPLAGPEEVATVRKRRTVRRTDGGAADQGEDEGGRRKKKGKKPRAYAGPEVYEHLRPLPDLLAPDLDVVFCGINPGVRSSTTGHHFGHPTNKFWRSLHYSGMTSRLVKSDEDHVLPTEFNYGMTVLVDRPTAEQSELSTHEMRVNALPFTEKLLRIRPRIVCFVGKKIWDVYESVIAKSAKTTDIGAATPAVKSEPVEVSAISDPSGTSVETSTVKVELVDHVEGVDHKPLDRHEVEPTPLVEVTRRITPVRTRIPARPKEKFDWTRPRPFRLAHVDDGGEVLYTYFWVVPNTSGLERTPLAEQIILFGHLNTFKNEIKAGQIPEGNYRDIDLDGVRETVEGMNRVAEAKREMA